MQDATTFLVAHGIKHILAAFIIKANEILILAATLQVALHALEVFGITGIFAVFVFFPKRLAVIGKRFVECEIAPAFGGYIITKPSVKQFMRDSALPIITIDQFSCILLRRLLVDGGSGVFHRAGN